MLSIKLVLAGVTTLLICSCSNNTHVNQLAKSDIVTGLLDRYWVDKPNKHICYYNVIDSNRLYSFSAIPPKELGKCTAKATVNLKNEEVVWIVDKPQYLTKI